MNITISPPARPLLTLVREASGLSQTDLAEKAGVSRTVVQNAEQGVRLQPVYARALAYALSLPQDEGVIEELTAMAPRQWVVTIERLEVDDDRRNE